MSQNGPAFPEKRRGIFGPSSAGPDRGSLSCLPGSLHGPSFHEACPHTSDDVVSRVCFLRLDLDVSAFRNGKQDAYLIRIILRVAMSSLACRR